METPRILVAGPNLTMQYIHRLPQLHIGGVNRVDATTLVAAGKGVNVCRALSRLHVHSQLLLFSGGLSGQRLERLLSEEKLTFEALPMESDLRVTNTLLGQQEITEIIGASPRISSYEEERYLSRLEILLSTHTWDAVIFTGTSPETGQAPCIYAKILEVLRSYQRGPVLIDLSRPILARIEPETNWFLKINGEEFSEVFDAPSASEELEISDCMLNCAWEQLMITNGSSPARMKLGGKIYVQEPPPIARVVNVIGAGDVACASTAVGLVRDLPPQTVLQEALELASISCRSQIPGSFETKELT